MDPNRLCNFDLNLLVVFDVLLAERNVTHAAQRLGLSQPAVSNALARLREALGDQLLVRTAQGMVPTARALSIQGQLSDALGGIGSVINDDASFDPRTARRAFVIAATDYVQFVLLGKLLASVRALAPGVTLNVVPPVGQFPWHELGAGGVDLVVGGARLRDVPHVLHRRLIFRDHTVCILRADHPYAAEPLTLQRYLELEHIEALPVGAVGAADELLTVQGHTRRVVMTVPNFLIAPFVVTQSDCCFTLAHRIARPLASILPLRIRPLPYDLPEVTIGAFWHERVQHDPAHRWLRKLLVEAGAALDGEPTRVRAAAPAIAAKTVVRPRATRARRQPPKQQKA
jgi:DNA-binding transcriptional LysR family regulator